MDRKQAYELVQQYVQGWEDHNLGCILESLAPDCLIIESHGATYHGVDHVRQWVLAWLSEGNAVESWAITSFHYLDGAAAFEWRFSMTAPDTRHVFDGASVVEFGDHHIAAIREYRRTAAPYDWVAPAAS